MASGKPFSPSITRQCMLACTRGGIADFDPERVENDDGIHPFQRPAFQRPGLPFADLVQNGIGDAANRSGDT